MLLGDGRSVRNEIAGLAALALGIALSAAPANASLSHRYSFDSNANDSVGGANGTVVGSPTFGTNGINLDASSRVDLPAAVGTTLASSESFTLEAWVTWSSGFIWQPIGVFGTSVSNYITFGPNAFPVSTEVAYIDLVIGGGAEHTPQDTASLAGTGRHIAAVFDGPNNAARLYVDGVLKDTTAISGTGAINVGSLMGTPSTRQIGGRDFFPLNDFPFVGSITEFRIYNTALSTTEVATDAANGPDAVPEPAALSLLGLGAMGLLLRRRHYA